MDLSVITVTWNSEEFIAEQIQSVKKACQKISYEHFIIDNASSDKTVETIEHNFPDIKLVKNSSNVGLAVANNMAAKRTQGKFILLLNPDMRLTEGSLDVLVSWMEKYPSVGIAGPRLISSENRMRDLHKPFKFPTLTSLILTALKIPVLFLHILDIYSYTAEELKNDLEVDGVRGAFLLLRRELYEKVGFVFDPRYFIWFEDVDICREAKRLGYKVVFTPVISCIDYAGQSFKKRNWIKRQKQFFKSAIIYLKKWEPQYKSFLLSLFVPIGVCFIWIYSLVSRFLPLTRFKNAIER